MERTLHITFSAQEQAPDYDILIGNHILPRFAQRIPLTGYSNLAIITDAHVEPLWLAPLQQGLPSNQNTSVCVLPPGECHKTIESVQRIWQHLAHHGCDRKSLVLNLGGGVVGDLGGFAASTYMRGIDFVQIPTTLLAQVDASVGGKVGCNVNGIKNLVGSFQQPKAVVIDIATLQTLPENHLRAGWAEIIKHALIQDRAYLDSIRACPTKPHPTPSELIAIIQHSCTLKSAIVQQDERESGCRKILNFGHTVGHALESLALHTEQPLLHGEAVALGMVAEAEISRHLGYLSSSDLDWIEDTLLQYQLPIRLPRLWSWDTLYTAMLADKKNVHGTTRWSLLQALGHAIFDVEVDTATIQNGLERLWHV